MADHVIGQTDDFPPADAARWRERVEAELKGFPWRKLGSRTLGGLEIQPLYTAEDWTSDGDPGDLPGAAPHVRGAADPAAPPGWDVHVEVADPDPAEAAARIRHDLEHGASSILLRLDPHGTSGVAVRTAADLEVVLADVDPTITPVALEAGPRFGPAATLLDELVAKRALDPAALLGSHLADPLGDWLQAGGLPVPLPDLMTEMAALAARTAAASPRRRSVLVDAARVHDAGADEVLELACTLSNGLAYLKTLVDAGLGVDAAARQIHIRCAVDGELFGGIARLRALRRLWDRVVAACGGDDEARRLSLTARTSRRMMTRRDPWVNILRATTATFAAVVGGADAVCVLPFDVLDNVPDGFSRRIARNVQIILQEESHLGHVIDPAGGCWHLERRTEDLARAAWTLFQEIESRGGLVAVARDGWLQARTAESRDRHADLTAHRRAPITGVSEFPNLDEASVVRARPAPPPGEAPGDLALPGEDGALHDAVDALTPYRGAEVFEVLRDAADAHMERAGARPSVFLCTLGTLAEHNARATWTRNALAAGGLVCLGGEPYADIPAAATACAASGATVAVICGTDTAYAEQGQAVAAALRDAGAAHLVLAGRFGDLESDWRAAGVDTELYLGADILHVLRGLHETLEVTS